MRTDSYDRLSMVTRSSAALSVGAKMWAAACALLAIAPTTASSAEVRLEGAEERARLGMRVGVVGDVNGDGFDDIVVSAPFAENANGLAVGRVDLHHGSAVGPVVPPAWSMLGATEGEGFGLALAVRGDFNCDGLLDLVVGAPGYGATMPQRGRVSVFTGDGVAFSSTAWWEESGATAGEQHGSSVALAPPAPDGCSTLLVGAPSHGGVFPKEGRARAYRVDGSGAPAEIWSASGGQPNARFGTSVALSWRLDGDWLLDALVGAPGWDGGAGRNQGRIAAFMGTPMGFATAPTWSALGAGSSQFFGADVTSGDATGDFLDEILVGAWSALSGNEVRGSVHVFPNTPAGLAGSPVTLVSDQEEDAFGSSVASVGDFDGDGLGDFAVGARQRDLAGIEDAGTVTVLDGAALLGGGAGTHSVFNGGAVEELFASSIAVGDVNGDGVSDLVVGAPGASALVTHGGAVVVELSEVSN